VIRFRTLLIRLERIRAAAMPKIDKPILFDTPEADAIVSALEVFPPDNPWSLVVEDWPLHPNSKNIFDISGFSPEAQAILKGLKKYGMFVADNGLDWTISVAPDSQIPLLHEEFSLWVRVRGHSPTLFLFEPLDNSLDG